MTDTVKYKANGLPKYVYREVTRHGKTRFQFKRLGLTSTITEQVGTEGFEAKYKELMSLCEQAALLEYNSTKPRPYTNDQIVSRLLSKCRTRAKRKNLEMTLDRGWLLNRLHDQRYRCAVSKVRLSSENYEGHKTPWQPSVDRIDPQTGYTPENCQIVAAIVNLAKLDWDENDIVDICFAVCMAKNKL